jgi:hypothetical protein
VIRRGHAWDYDRSKEKPAVVGAQNSDPHWRLAPGEGKELKRTAGTRRFEPLTSTLVRHVGGGFPDCADHRRDLMFLILLALQVLPTNGAKSLWPIPSASGQQRSAAYRGKLLEANDGEVAE